MAMKDYKDKRWLKKRQVILKRDDYLCKECKRYGKRRQAEQVHHINPLEEYPELILTNDNLISLCTKCHDKMHDRNNNKLTPLGMQWVERVKDKIKIILANYIPPPN
jgi:5-methylcytosine-specific restriction endonuclease McrA